jgi:hypothetical protein
MRGVLIPVLASLALPATVLGQVPTSLRAGTVVRVWATGAALSNEPSAVVRHEGDTLVIRRYRPAGAGYGTLGRPAWDTVQVAWASVRRVDMQLGRSHVRGALRGFLFGVSSGLIAGGVVAWAEHAESEGMSILAIPTLGVAGAVAGTFFGAVIGSTRWRRVHP